MKTTLIICFALCTTICFGQYDYAVSEANPYGLPNPEAPEQIKDYEAMIGKCNCTSTTRKQDGTWNLSETIIWEWKYILNGYAVQDLTLKPSGVNSGSIRQFNQDSSRWYVHWFSSKKSSPVLSVWEGNKKDDKIVLYKEQKAPNGMDGYFRLTFYDMSESGYKWIGEWVDIAEKIVYPTWKIECVR